MTKNDIDINAILAGVLQKEIESIFVTLKGFISKPIKEFSLSFKKYLIASHTRISKTKTLLYKDSAVDIDDIYVDLDLLLRKKTMKLHGIIESLLPTNNYIISATAGAGKSILAKKIFLSILKKGDIGVPIFFELRNLNNTDNTIIDSILDIFDSYNLELNKELFEKLLIKNKFILILDGYDEIELKIKKKIDKELNKFIEKFTNTPIFITTRPNDQIQSLIPCDVFTVKPLDKSQAIELVTKLNYDLDIKRKFIKQLNKELYEKHSDFLSNPLLLTIMLMTYGQIAEIPEKMHIFYEQAFDVLFFKHDASKAMYKRDIRTKLPIDDFKKVLSFISFNSYLKDQINFSHSSLIDHIRTSKKLSGLVFNNENYKYDLLNSVCILVNDGTTYTYAHRSFQEYFAAHFISNLAMNKKENLLRKLLKKTKSDKVLSLAYEINSSNIEKHLMIPVGKEYVQKYNNSKNEIDKLKICFKNINVVHIPGQSPHNYYVSSATDYWYFLTYFEEIYSTKFKSLAPRYKTTLTKKAFIKLFGSGEVDKNLTINQKNLNTLLESGIFELQEKRVRFLIAILKKIEKRNNAIDINLEDYVKYVLLTMLFIFIEIYEVFIRNNT